jgi:PAS domain S-box-containing protein
MIHADHNAVHPVLNSIRHSPIAAVVSDPKLPDNPIVAVNKAFCELTGYSESEILGRNCRFLAGADTEPWLTDKLKDGIDKRKPMLVEILNYKRDGTPFRNAVLVAPAFDNSGELEYFVGSQMELAKDEDSISETRHRISAELVEGLSPRQREVLKQMAHGLRSKQIAFNLSLSEKTVQMHRMLIFKKLATSNASNCVRIAVEAGL